MIKEVGNIELENGFLFKFWSDKLGKSFYVVQFNDWGYINIFDESKEKVAVNSLLDRDISCQDRDDTLPMNLLSEDEEFYFKEYCNVLEEQNFQYEYAAKLFFMEFPIPW
jgi:hypothetical protein